MLFCFGVCSVRESARVCVFLVASPITTFFLLLAPRHLADPFAAETVQQQAREKSVDPANPFTIFIFVARSASVEPT